MLRTSVLAAAAVLTVGLTGCQPADKAPATQGGVPAQPTPAATPPDAGMVAGTAPPAGAQGAGAPVTIPGR